MIDQIVATKNEIVHKTLEGILKAKILINKIN